MNDQIKEYETKNVLIKDIKLDDDNPNVMDPGMEERLDSSMKVFGNTQDIVVDKKTMILADGEHRLKAYHERGIKSIPAKLVDFKDDTERRLYRQAANKIRGKHDRDKDLNEYRRFVDEPSNESLLKLSTGLSLESVEKLINKPTLFEKEIMQTDKLGRLTITCPHCGEKFEKGKKEQ